MGFEPTYNGFANRRLGPLGYAARMKNTFIRQTYGGLKFTHIYLIYNKINRPALGDSAGD